MGESIFVEVFSDTTLPLPNYATKGAAGMDIYSSEDITIRANDTTLVPTGLYVAIPEGFEIQIRPRSGMSLKTGMRVANAPGTIDCDYRGQICVIMQNTNGSEDFTIKRGDRIAQMVLQRVPQILWRQVDSKEKLSSTDRGSGGFGSTGN